MAKKVRDLSVKKPASAGSVKGGKMRAALLKKKASLKKKSSMRRNVPGDM